MRSGVPYMVASALSFSLMAALVKLAGQRLPAEQIVLCRVVVTLVLSVAIVRRARLGWGTRRRQLVMRGLFGSFALFSYYWALTHLPLAESAVLHHMAPLFTAVLAWLLLGERTGRAGVAALVVGIVGVVIVARPAGFVGGSALPLAAVVIAVVGAGFSAAAMVTVRSLAQVEDPRVIVLYFPLVSLPLALPFALRVWLWPTAVEWLILLGVGVATQIAQLTMTEGLRRERAGRATAIGYLQVAFAVGWGAVLFDELPSVWTVLGAGLIVGSTLLVAARPKPPAPIAADE
jgi:drug/metabolite transporter (DMT)-like permease